MSYIVNLNQFHISLTQMRAMLELAEYYYRYEKVKRKQVIAYFGNTLSQAERNCWVTRKEQLAIVKTIEQLLVWIGVHY